jgi:hypothetical protein
MGKGLFKPFIYFASTKMKIPQRKDEKDYREQE